MIWYLTARCWAATLAAAVLVIPVAGVFRAAAVQLPDLLSGTTVALPVPVLLPVLPAALVLWSMNRGAPAHEATAVRRPDVLDLTALTALITAQVTAALLLSPWFSATELLAVARNTAGYAGLCLLLRSLTGPVAANLVMTVFPLLCVRLGTTYAQDGPGGHWWAWPLHPVTSPAASVQVLALCAGAAAISALAWLPRRRRIPATVQ